MFSLGCVNVKLIHKELLYEKKQCLNKDCLLPKIETRFLVCGVVEVFFQSCININNICNIT